jgi:hypothetical protein
MDYSKTNTGYLFLTPRAVDGAGVCRLHSANTPVKPFHSSQLRCFLTEDFVQLQVCNCLGLSIAFQVNKRRHTEHVYCIVPRRPEGIGGLL